ARAGRVATGGTATRRARRGPGARVGDSQPYPGMERLDGAATALNAGANTGAAAILAAPGLRQFHETGRHQDGHPGSHAGIEVHGTGVSLNGPAARLLAH